MPGKIERKLRVQQNYKFKQKKYGVVAPYFFVWLATATAVVVVVAAAAAAVTVVKTESIHAVAAEEPEDKKDDDPSAAAAASEKTVTSHCLTSLRSLSFLFLFCLSSLHCHYTLIKLLCY